MTDLDIPRRPLDGRVAAVTGAASGIGAATARLFSAMGATVISIDLRDAQVNVDLSTPRGRSDMIAQVETLAPDGLDIVVPCAGVTRVAPELIVALNYFGAVATLTGFRHLLSRRKCSHAIGVASVAAIADTDDLLVAACLAGDEDEAIAVAKKLPAPLTYNSCKRALSLWVRQSAPLADWAGSDIYMNAVAPGFVKTPMTERLLGDEAVMASIRKITPRAVDHVAEPEVLAEVIASIAALRGGYLVGQVIFVDGGSDALLRPDMF
ncbi:MAG: SDR family oxidoreductase [Hyphomonadaceae bacterium]|nr:SDR family oxidoreductase [Hyphomonadaceae bacterium]